MQECCIDQRMSEAAPATKPANATSKIRETATFNALEGPCMAGALGFRESSGCWRAATNLESENVAQASEEMLIEQTHVF
jgi:hypothetical protein